MKISHKGLELIKNFEGFSPIIYVCPAGYPTIGYGHLVNEKNKEQFLDGISHADADKLLASDCSGAENAVARLITAPLSQHQFDALVSFTFNLGGGALQSSTLRAVINRGEYDEAPAQFMRWVWAGGRKLSGLIRRRRAEADLFMAVNNADSL